MPMPDFSQIALAIGVLTSSWGLRVRRILWIGCGGGSHTGSRWGCPLVCVGARVRRSKTGLSLKLSADACIGVRGLQI